MSSTEFDDVSPEVWGAIDELRELCWSYVDHEFVVSSLIPAFLDGTAKLTPREGPLKRTLRSELSEALWQQLAELYIWRRDNVEVERLEQKRLAEEAEAAEASRKEEALAAEKARKEEALAAEASRKEEALAAEEARKAARRARREKERVLEKRRSEVRSIALRLFQSDYLSAREDFLVACGEDAAQLIDLSDLQAEFVRNWARTQMGWSLDKEQASAVGAVGSHVKVTARAGSGKTRTLVARALFLVMHCEVEPRRLMLLAFNKAAATEMEERLESLLGPDRLPFVMTFHALAYRLVHPDEEIIFDDRDLDDLRLSGELQSVIDDFVRSDEYGPQVKRVMIAAFEEDWEALVRAGFDKPIKEALDERRSHPGQCLKGHAVKSFGEKLIANTLFENDIAYFYEPVEKWNGSRYRPDFVLATPSGSKVVIEYFGMVGDANYDAEADRKRDFWRLERDVPLLDPTPFDITSKGPDVFRKELLRKLSELGIPSRQLSDEEIWERIGKRAIDQFTAAVVSAVSRARKQNLDVDGLETMIELHESESLAESLFLDVLPSVFRYYLERIEEKGRIDFDGLLWRAVESILGGQTRFSGRGGAERGDVAELQFMMIDELQDFSAGFQALVEAVDASATGLQIFGVGDNWQAINGFAGSDLRYFDQFTSAFSPAESLGIRTNYRSGKQIVAVTNKLMTGLGRRAVANSRSSGSVAIATLDSLRLDLFERQQHDRDEHTPALLRLVQSELKNDRRVTLLFRRNKVPWIRGDGKLGGAPKNITGYLQYLRSLFPEDQRTLISVSTAHGSKGLEDDAVVVCDADAGSYPLIHPSWIFNRLFGDTLESIEAEERRLFYVAISRPMHSLTILTDSVSMSPFVDDLRQTRLVAELEWGMLPPFRGNFDENAVEIRVHNGYEVRDILKGKAYHFEDFDKSWRKVVPGDLFDLGALRQQAWTSKDCRVEVRSASGEIIAEL